MPMQQSVVCSFLKRSDAAARWVSGVKFFNPEVSK
jgi:hypothetical protein